MTRPSTMPALVQKHDGYAENMRELIGWYMAGKVKPVIEGQYRLAEAPQVLKRVLGREASGKLVLVP